MTLNGQTDSEKAAAINAREREKELWRHAVGRARYTAQFAFNFTESKMFTLIPEFTR